MTGPEHGHGSRGQDEVLAGEYVLGVLSLEARRRVEQRLASDRDFARIVERWQADLAAFDEDYDDVAPPPSVFSRIEARLFGESSPAGSQSSVWNSVRFWRWTSLATSALAIAAVVVASGLLQPQRAGSPLVAELAAPDNAVNMLASYDTASGRMRIVPVASGAPEQKSLELWLVPGSGSALSLGVFPEGTGGELLIPAEFRDQIDDGTTFAITLEPFGGSPTGVATGPIVASGIARRP